MANLKPVRPTEGNGGEYRADRVVLLVGGAGYVGSVLVRRLLGRGYRVRVLDNLLYNNSLAVEPLYGEPGFDFIKGDIRKRDDIVAAASDVTDVVLLASLVGDPISKKFPELTREVNVEGSRNVVDVFAGRGIGRFVFLSTCSNYGLRNEDELATENSELDPRSVYAETKVEFEHFLQHDCEGVDFATTTLRLATAYGLSPRMRFDLTIADFTRQVFLERKLEVYDQETWRPYCHLNDISEAIIGVLEAPRELVAGETFNVGGSSENYTKQSIVEIITEQIEAEIVYGQGGGDPRNYKVDFDKVRTTLGFAPSQSVKAHVPQLLRALESGLYGRADALLTYYGNHDVFL